MRSGGRTAASRVVFVTDSTIRGGAEHSLRHLLGALDDRYEATIVGPSSEVVAWLGAARPTAEQVVVPPVGRKTDIRSFVSLAAALWRRRPAVVHANLTSLRSCRYALLLSLAIPGLQPVAVEQLPTPARTSWQRRWKRAVACRLAAHVAVGEQSARIVEADLGLPAHSVLSIPNGVPDVPLRAVERPVEGMIVGSHARLDTQKGFDVLLSAMAPLDASTVLVGDGPERAALEAQAADLGSASRVVLVGWQERARDWLTAFDVYVLPSRNEGFPLALVEAMLAERPIVAADVGSISEAIHEGTGVLVPAEDEVALRSAIQRLLDDPAARRAMGAQARAEALEHHTDEQMARKYDDLYRRLGA
jgi:glycosyltransferase involved in cell wall biosynthesis